MMDLTDAHQAEWEQISAAGLQNQVESLKLEDWRQMTRSIITYEHNIQASTHFWTMKLNFTGNQLSATSSC